MQGSQIANELFYEFHILLLAKVCGRITKWISINFNLTVSLDFFAHDVDLLLNLEGIKVNMSRYVLPKLSMKQTPGRAPKRQV